MKTTLQRIAALEDAVLLLLSRATSLGPGGPEDARELARRIEEAREEDGYDANRAD